MQRGGTRPPGELLQTSMTVAAIAIALATLSVESDSVGVDWFPVDAFFLVGGLLSLCGSVFAMVELWEEAGLDAIDFMLLPNPDRPPTFGWHDHTLRFTSWGMLLIGLAYGAVTVGIYF